MNGSIKGNAGIGAKKMPDKRAFDIKYRYY